MLFLLRYDTERSSRESMAGFLERAITVHRADDIPATFFCKGDTVDSLKPEFQAFYQEVKDDPLFDIQDHSYTHIGVGYEAGKPVDVLKADYERSFAVHEEVFGKRPKGISICGTSGADGARLNGFDETEKSRSEFEMLVGLGMRMINSFLVDVDEITEFTSYAPMGHPDVMGFPSGYSDTSWMYRNEHGDPVEFVKSRIDEHASNGWPMALMLHDWVAWRCAADRDLTHVRTLVDYAREKGYELVTHASCYRNGDLWQAA